MNEKGKMRNLELYDMESVSGGKRSLLVEEQNAEYYAHMNVKEKRRRKISRDYRSKYSKWQ